MISAPDPPAANSNRWRGIGFGLLGVLGVVLGIVLADLAFDDADPGFPEAGEEIQVRPAGEDYPGGVLLPIDVPVAGPLFEDAAEVGPTEFDDEGNPILPAAATGGAAGTATGGGTGGQGGGPPPQGGVTFPDPIGIDKTIGRWRDACADVLNPACPLGVGGTIDDVIDPLPLQVIVLPETTAAQLPGLRCDPGWQTPTRIPVVVLSNRPLHRTAVSLATPDGDWVAFAEWVEHDPEEVSRYKDRLANSPSTIAPTLADGAHGCVSIPIDETPYTGGGIPDRNGPFVVTVAALSAVQLDPGPQAPGQLNYYSRQVEVAFTGSHTDVRPQTRLLPVNEGHAYLTVSHSESERVGLWVYDRADSNGPEGCESLTHGPISDLLEPVTSTPVAVDPEILARSDYPWDPQYSHYSQWLLKLEPSSRYTVCIQRVAEASVEEWSVETPDGAKLEVVAGVLAHETHVGAGELDIAFVGLPGCEWAQFSLGRLPDQDQPGKGGYHEAVGDVLCQTHGPLAERFYLAPFINGGYAGLPSPYGHSSERVLEHCVNDPLGPDDENWCQVMEIWYSLGWDRVYMLEVDFRVTPVRTNNRPDPLDWGFSQVLRLGGTLDAPALP